LERRFGNSCRRHEALLIALIASGAVALVNFHVMLYGDDFFYLRFTSHDFSYFLSRHIEHYRLANGRVIVHLLATAFLGIHPFFWRLFNSLMLFGIVFFGAKTASFAKDGERAPELWPAILLAASIFFLDPVLTRQSVYWLTGSFNYVYPMLVLFLYWYLLTGYYRSGRHRRIMPVMAFLAGATTEQAGLMAFGLTLILTLEKAMSEKRRPGMGQIIILLSAAFGMLSVIASPSVFYRAAIEDAPAEGLINLLKYNIKYQSTTFLFSKIMLPYHLMAMLSAAGTIFACERESRGKASNAVLTAGISAALLWLFEMLKGDVSPEKVDRRVLCYYLLIGAGYVLMLSYAAYRAYRVKLIGNHTLPAIALVLCLGSQLMMVVSPVYGPRNLLCAILMLALYSSALMPRQNAAGVPAVLAVAVCFLYRFPVLIPLPVAAFLLCRNKNLKSAAALSYASVVLISLTVLWGTANGYAKNAAVYEKNIDAARYRSLNETGVLIQKRLPDELYGWAMPYHNPYYDPYYKYYLAVDQKTQIIWQ